MNGVNEIRSAFLQYFGKHGHEQIASSPLVPRNDPTLMFTNAGMVQFKNVFTGLESRPYNRAATSQKCVRAGGKHNDLDNVGYTARHHTFFEMLGNFSFGDYFKENAIELAWNLITKEFGLPKDKLLVTVYHTDEDAANFWKSIAGLPDDRIIRIATSDNFWAMGDTGPCGPCSEIFYDHGDHVWGGPPGSLEEDGDRFIEIWNLVFMQFEQMPGGERVELPRPSIDTGMGLERVAAVLQGVHNNYDIDLFRQLIRASVDVIGAPITDETVASHRVIADHLRATAFLIADGVLPSNEGRGYVLRRIMRRAMRHAKLLGAREPVIYKLLPTLIGEMGRAYPELGRAEALISETLQLEEKRFLVTLDRGLSLLNDATQSMHAGDKLDGETAFKLYDTYGFPLDLTQDALRARDIHVDLTGFQDAMARQKAEARASWAGSGEVSDETVYFGIRERLGATEFLGYDTETAEGQVAAIVVNGKEVESAAEGQEASVVLNQTPFYGESGGQVGDMGVLKAEGVTFNVSSTQKVAGGLFVHRGQVSRGTLGVGAALELIVDHGRRSNIRANHSATHLLHEGLREVLGTHVAQKGSLVSPERLRFDFSHPKPMDDAELAEVERLANEIVLQNAPVETRLMAVDDAIAMGAMALFGEKYGDEVRVVSMGQANEGDKKGKTFSVELCGGTHVRGTGDIGLVHVLSESAVGAGVRRIEALTGSAARAYLQEQDARVRRIAASLKVGAAEIADRVDGLLEERRKLERELADARRKLALAGDGGSAAPAPKQLGDVAFLGRVLEGVPARELKAVVDGMKQGLGSGVVAVVAVDDGKASVVVGVTDDLTSKINAVDLVRAAAEAIGGKGGGGRPDMAQAGGPDGDKAELAISAVEKLLAA
ncbi:alanine--tRNA ligase [Aureimonas fodinaquatilis]|uniref:Alanine--tRNA ligase n=1 Tax=Aureimonas fodinaquatilis TaxID=2565783 RepID=A0A5B0E3W8_9HYPH|nr:alanine--tRNA ligase [Aureimonas fodinaquatilis]KAA0972631.1 alanine--tRNA ligase [Aureimonas fodinaquatilis]